MFRARIIQFILRRRKLVAIAVGLITLVALLSATRVRFNSSMDVWFLEDDPAMETYHRFLQSFGGDELVVVGLFTDDIYTPEGLATLDQLTREAAAAPWVHRVISLTTLEVARDEGGAMEVTPLVPKGALGDAEIAALRAEILRHPSGAEIEILDADARRIRRLRIRTPEPVPAPKLLEPGRAG